MKVNWKSEKEHLEKMLSENISYEEIGRYYNVTGNAVKKAAKKLGLVLEQKREINPKEHFNKKTVEDNIIVEDKILIKEPIKNNNFVNKKNIGELGEQIAIGELGKYGINVAIPLSDNLPFDIIVYYNNKFFKCQVKSTNNYKNGSCFFSLTSENGYLHKTHYYTNEEVDVFVLCDLNNIFLFTFDEINNKKNITLRYDKPNNNQHKNINYAIDYIISLERIEEVFK